MDVDPRGLLSDKPLDVYLNDHLAGARFGSDLARRLAGRMGGTTMNDLAEEIEQDRETLQRLMDRLGTSRNPVKGAATWVAEKVSHVKLSGLTAGHGQLGRFMALETLSLGIEGKGALWVALAEVADHYPELREFDLVALRERAAAQRRIVEAERTAAGRRAFTGAAC
jgi:predicted DNA-binding transcriptional regulator YafY